MKIFLAGILILAFSGGAFAQNLDNLRQQKPVTFHGGINLRTMFYAANGIPNRRQPFTYVLTGSPVLSVYGFTIPFTFILSEQERSFRQPFNQFGLSPTYKWITLHGGYRNLSFSPFTLDGHTMLGAGFELRPGKWHIGFMYGRLNRAIIANQNTAGLQAVGFTRRGFAGKVGYGDEQSNVFVSFVKAKDDASSLNYQNVGQDTLGLPPVTPAENLVMSGGGRLAFLKTFFVEGEAAVSIFTNNIQSSINIDSSVANVPKWLRSAMTVNASSEVNKAFRAGAGYKGKIFGLSLQYRRIDPNYQSMGAYFFQNDLENITLNPSLLLWQGKLRFAGSIGTQRDNLSGRKQATARRVIGSANLSATFTERFGVDFSYSNFATSQNPVVVKFNDSLRVAQTTQNFSLTPHYFIMSKEHSHVFTLSLNYMILNDFSLLSASRNINSTNAFFNYQYTVNATGLSLFSGLNYARLNATQANSGNQGITFGGGKGFFRNALNVRLTGSVLQNLQGNTKNMLFTGGVSGGYKFEKKHQFNFLLNYVSNRGNAQTLEQGGYGQFTELRGEVGYGFSF
jgi:hypothetical protein